MSSCRIQICKIFERKYLIIRLLAILSEMCTDFGKTTVSHVKNLKIEIKIHFKI
jgi:hypothetical protein